MLGSLMTLGYASFQIRIIEVLKYFCFTFEADNKGRKIDVLTAAVSQSPVVSSPPSVELTSNRYCSTEITLLYFLLKVVND